VDFLADWTYVVWLCELHVLTICGDNCNFICCHHAYSNLQSNFKKTNGTDAEDMLLLLVTHVLLNYYNTTTTITITATVTTTAITATTVCVG